jgi:enamine deaminase RidA (YjgF/YER057c/UK114 family)
MRTTLNPEGLGAPTGSPDTPFYSWTARKGNIVALAGMVPYDSDKNLAGDDLWTQAPQAFANLKTAIEAVGGTVDDVIQITVYVPFTDLQRDVYPPVNKAVHECFGTPPPARAVVGGVAMPRETELIQVVALAVLDEGEAR